MEEIQQILQENKSSFLEKKKGNNQLRINHKNLIIIFVSSHMKAEI